MSRKNKWERIADDMFNNLDPDAQQQWGELRDRTR